MKLSFKELCKEVEQRGGRWFLKDENGNDVLHLDRKKDGEYALYFDRYRGEDDTMKAKFVSTLRANSLGEVLQLFFCAETERSYIIQFCHSTDGWHSKTYFKNSTQRKSKKKAKQ